MNMATITDILKTWLDDLNEDERNQAELLEQYFMFKSNVPGKHEGVPMIADPKTTADIQDDLSDMMQVSASIIFTFMRKSGYGFTTLKDGSVKWAIWRWAE